MTQWEKSDEEEFSKTFLLLGRSGVNDVLKTRHVVNIRQRDGLETIRARGE